MRAALFVVLACVCPAWIAAQPNLQAGRHGFEVCAGCHGFAGEGSELVGAPQLAGLPPWYLERQMRNFASGARGALGDDHGRRMALMARAPGNDRALQDLLAYIGTLPRRVPQATLTGDANSGAQRYAVCAACHGQKGEGSEALGAPGLSTLDDWYVVRQLRLYVDGLRGFNSDDAPGQQMRVLAGTVTEPKVQNDLASYIRSLKQ